MLHLSYTFIFLTAKSHPAHPGYIAHVKDYSVCFSRKLSSGFFSKRFGNIRSGSAGSDKVDSTFAVIVFGEVEAAFVA